MRCGCPICGEYAVQAERGMMSSCVCPSCGWECKDCMGGKNERFQFISRDNLDKIKDIDFEDDF